jgi:bifunctional N-acetylglucosamine-1-phosphate-uridyltransferase/glucosamine-1-phosphate-acetyltransferase GlmU-like protein
MEVIVPAAGLSTRFPGTIPKYLLKDNNGKIMLHNAIEPYIGKYNITVGILKQHDEMFDSGNIVRQLGVKVVVIETVSKGPADTVYQIIKLADLNTKESMLIKDCDSYFNHNVSEGNYICTSTIGEHEILFKIDNKSFVIANENNIVQTIVEKSVVSNEFCVGGYKFDNIQKFITYYESLLSTMTSEFFVSHLIQYGISKGEIFLTKRVSDYADVGTIKEWEARNKEIF